MSVILRAAPWLFFGLGSFLLGQRWAAPLAAVVTLVIVIVGFVRGAKPAEMILDVATFVYFVVFSVLTWVAPSSPVVPYVAAGAQLWLAVVVGGFLIGRLPFTLPLAQREVPAEVGKSQEFYKFNVLLTSIWLAAFVISGVILLVVVALKGAVWLQVLIVVVALVVPALIQSRIVAKAQSRMPA